MDGECDHLFTSNYKSQAQSTTRDSWNRLKNKRSAPAMGSKAQRKISRLQVPTAYHCNCHPIVAANNQIDICKQSEPLLLNTQSLSPPLIPTMSLPNEYSHLNHRLATDEVDDDSQFSCKNSKTNLSTTKYCYLTKKPYFAALLILLLLILPLNPCVVGFNPESADNNNNNNPEDDYYSTPSTSTSMGTSSSATTVNTGLNNAYFVAGLANTIRKLNATLISRQSVLEPFQLQFRTACWFGNLIGNDRYRIGINSNTGNLSFTRLNDQQQIIQEIIFKTHVADGQWHSLLFNESKIYLLTPGNGLGNPLAESVPSSSRAAATQDRENSNTNTLGNGAASGNFESSENTGGALADRIFITDLRQLPPRFQGLQFFDGFVGCIKLTYALSSNSIPYSTTINYQNYEDSSLTITDHFQFGPTNLYQLCLDPNEDLADLYTSCPHPDNFVLCAECRNGARCELTNYNYYDEGESTSASSELDLPMNHCVCPQDSLYTGKYCEQSISAVDAFNNLTTIVDGVNTDAFELLLPSNTNQDILNNSALGNPGISATTSASPPPMRGSNTRDHRDRDDDGLIQDPEVERVNQAESTIRPISGRASSTEHLGGAPSPGNTSLESSTTAVTAATALSTTQANQRIPSDGQQQPTSSTSSTAQAPTGSSSSSVSTSDGPCPCQHGGVCIRTAQTTSNEESSSAGGNTSPSSTFTCSCEGTGYYGEHCQMENTFCHNSPCIHGICQPKSDSYQCYCLPGFAGEHCDINFDECLSSPCLNGATCLDEVNKFRCQCAPGYKGVRCQEEINECESSPCRNGGTCRDALANYTCECVPGFSGHSCEIDIDECEPKPCQNNGICTDQINGFTCNCTDTGFEGYFCDREIDDCFGDPCQNDGRCEDGFKSYTCHCPDGFEGVDCQFDVDECAPEPCINNGTCFERSNASLYNSTPSDGYPKIFQGPFSYNTAAGYECTCIPGYAGKNCEVDIDECADSPCSSNGKCIDGQNSFSCQCLPGYEGTLCETEINECASNPCERGTCVDKLADYACLCPEGYGAKNCSVELVGCNNVKCFNGGTCIPSYIKDKHDFTCSCPFGYAGNLCQAVTTLSFNGSGYAEILTDDENYRRRYSMSFRFRTTLSEVLIAIGQGSTYFMLVLSGGKLNLQSSLLNSLRGISSGSNVSNAEWHHVSVFINESHIALAVNMEQTIHPIQFEPEQLVETGFNTTVIGGATPGLSSLTSLPFFVGCIQDVIINEKKIIPGNMDDLETVKIDLNVVTIGCKRQEQCQPNPCENRGSCFDLWQKYECKCPRPYLGGRCEAQYIAATFGYENTQLSIAAIHIPVEIGRKFEKSFEISMFVRTREPRGTIFLLTDNRKDNKLYIKAYVEEDGQLGVLAKLDEAKEETYKVGGLAINDGEPHLISFQKEKGLVKINVNGTEHFRKSLPLKPTTLFNPDTMYIGGIPTSSQLNPGSAGSSTTSSGIIRSTTEVPRLVPAPSTAQAPTGNSAEDNSSSGGGPSGPSAENSGLVTILPTFSVGPTTSTITSPSASSSTMHSSSRTQRSTTNPVEPFKGVIQDVRVNFSEGSGHFASATSAANVNKYVVEFFPITQVNSSYLMGDSLGQVQLIGQVQKGVVSDDTCSTAPCLNNGTCQITWNDFICICPELNGNPQYDGKTCNHLLPCSIVNCPDGSQCKNIQHGSGFECISQVAFDGKGKVSPHYSLRSIVGVENLTFNQVSFRYRSQQGGSILHIDNGRDRSLKISIEQQQSATSSSTAMVANSGDPATASTTRTFLVVYINGNRTTEKATKALDGNWHSIKLALDAESSTFVLSYDGTTKSAIAAARAAAAAASSSSTSTENGSGSGNSNGNSANGNGPSSGTGSTNGGGNSASSATNNIIREGLASFVVEPDFIKEIVTSPGAQIIVGSFIRSGATSSYSIDSSSSTMAAASSVIHPESFHADFYRGCLDEIYLGPYRLPFVTPSQLLRINTINQSLVETTAPVAFYIDEIEGARLPSVPPGGRRQQQQRQEGLLQLGCVLCYDEECRNQGQCENSVEAFECACQIGFNGTFCEINIDECENNFCTNGSTCIDQVANYTCSCPNGYTGWLCDIEINECESDPCQNSGICHDDIGFYTCTCPLDYIGDNCEKRKVSSCKDAPCENNAVCINTQQQEDGTFFNCNCSPGFIGKTCSKMIDYCENITCENGGTCLRKSSGLGAECLCVPGWDGPKCEKDVNECLDMPCKNGGRCNDLLNRFTCDCEQTGFEGTTCEQDIDECSRYNYRHSLCPYNSTCENTRGNYTCHCFNNYCGIDCSIPNPCNELEEEGDLLCENGGRCICSNYEPYFQCECQPYYKGLYCNETITPPIGEHEKSTSINIVYIIAPILAIILIGLIVATIMLVRVAKKKRATRGVYSPSQQEYCNPRVELDNVLKPPPEERLI